MTHTDLINALYATLEDNPNQHEVSTRMALADMCEEAGHALMAAFHRWMLRQEKPYVPQQVRHIHTATEVLDVAWWWRACYQGRTSTDTVPEALCRLLPAGLGYPLDPQLRYFASRVEADAALFAALAAAGKLRGGEFND